MKKLKDPFDHPPNRPTRQTTKKEINFNFIKEIPLKINRHNLALRARFYGSRGTPKERDCSGALCR